jgi:DNA-binding transcriptional regulator LsrR (DeoR family)
LFDLLTAEEHQIDQRNAQLRFDIGLLARRVVGVQADMLRQIPLVLGVACGAVKAAAIHGALRARLINALVTDGEAARRVLELSDELCD